MFSRRKLLEMVVAVAVLVTAASGTAEEPGTGAAAPYRSEGGGAPKGSPSPATLGSALAAGDGASFATAPAATAAGAAQGDAHGLRIPSAGALVPDAGASAAAETRPYTPSDGGGEQK